MTLFELDELPGLIKQGKKVVLCVSPCGECGKNKGEILKAILEYKQHYISHLVADSLSVKAMLKRE